MPWTAADRAYAESLPTSYERLVVHPGAEAMAAELAGAPKAMRNRVLPSDWLASEGGHERKLPTDTQSPSPEIDDEGPPRVIHYDHLAARRGGAPPRAAIAVQRHIGGSAAKLIVNMLIVDMEPSASERPTGRSPACSGSPTASSAQGRHRAG